MRPTDAARSNLIIRDVHRFSSLDKLYCPVKSEVRQAENSPLLIGSPPFCGLLPTSP